MATLYFDDLLKTTKGTRIPYWDMLFNVSIKQDGELIWIHERFGHMRLYRALRVDEINYIAEDTGVTLWKNLDRDYSFLLEHPEEALRLHIESKKIV